MALVRERKDYELAARELGIPPGQAYLVATGIAADGGDTYTSEELERPGAIAASTQRLVHPEAKVTDPETHERVQKWLKSRVARDVQMQEAARSRDAAPGPREATEYHDIASVVTRDHNAVTALFKQLKTIPGVSKGGNDVQQSRRSSIVDMITVALSQHESTEEEYLWPAVRSRLENGDELRQTALEQEQEGKDLATEIGKLRPSEEKFDELAETFEAAIRKHVAFEDQVLLQLREAMSEDEQSDLGKKFQDAKAHAPTRPHRHAPKSPAGAVKAAGAMGKAFDATRDALGNRPAERRGKAEDEPEVVRPDDAQSKE